MTLRVLRRSERGAALVEFALVLPVLLLLVFGMIDFGKAINYWLDANHLAAEGARHVAVGRNLGQPLETYLRSQADTTELREGGTQSVAAPGLQTTLCYLDGNGAEPAGGRVQVRATVEYNWMPFLELGFTSTTITGSATSRIEQNNVAAVHPEDCPA